MAAYNFEPRLSRPINYASKMFSGRDLTGESSRKIGDIEILNGDGSLDYLMDYVWDERSVEVFVGGVGWEFTDFKSVLKAKIKDWEWNENTINVKLHDSKKLFSDSVQPDKYLGTGGEEGGEELTGTNKPLLYGKCLNVEPVLIDAENLIYQVHAGEIAKVMAVYFAGIAAKEGFGYAVDLDAGTITLLTNPLGTVTADVRGAVSSVGNTAVVIRHLIEDNSSLTWDDDFNKSSFNTVTKFNGIENGVYIRDGDKSIKSAVDELVQSINGYWLFDRQDKLRIGTVGVSSTVHAMDDVVNKIKRVTTPGPVWQTSINYQRNYTVMSDTEIAGAATEERKTFLLAEYRTASAEDNAVQVLHTDIEQTIDTNIQDLPAAQRQADKRLALFGRQRDTYQIEAPVITFDYKVGDGLLLTHDRFGLDTPTMFLITAVSENARNGMIKLDVWG